MRNHARTSDWPGAAPGLGQEELSVRGSDSGGQRAAILYTLTQTAVLNGLDPEAYLRDVLARMVHFKTYGAGCGIRVPELLLPTTHRGKPNLTLIDS